MSKPILTINASLASTGKKDGVSYTKSESELAKKVLLAILAAGQHIPADKAKDVPEDVVDTLATVWEENSDKGLGVPNLARRMYGRLEATHFTGEKDNLVSSDPTNWPKRRDYTSIGLILRGALKDLKVIDNKVVDEMFPTYYGKDKKAAKKVG